MNFQVINLMILPESFSKFSQIFIANVYCVHFEIFFILQFK